LSRTPKCDARSRLPCNHTTLREGEPTVHSRWLLGL
jgi:hypothetical protein